MLPMLPAETIGSAVQLVTYLITAVTVLLSFMMAARA